MIAVMSLF